MKHKSITFPHLNTRVPVIKEFRSSRSCLISASLSILQEFTSSTSGGYLEPSSVYLDLSRSLVVLSTTSTAFLCWWITLPAWRMVRGIRDRLCVELNISPNARWCCWTFFSKHWKKRKDSTASLTKHQVIFKSCTDQLGWIKLTACDRIQESGSNLYVPPSWDGSFSGLSFNTQSLNKQQSICKNKCNI